MNDIERELREVLEARAHDATVSPRPQPTVLRRARRRQVRTILTTSLTVAALLVVSIFGLRTVVRADRGTPANQPTVTKTMHGVSIIVPGSWYVIDPGTAGLNGPGPSSELPRLLLAVTPTELGDTFGCPALSGSASKFVMTIQEEPLAFSGPSSGSWPVSLQPMEVGSAQSDCYPGWTFERAWWTTGARTFEATVALAPDVSEADRTALGASFASMTFEPATGSPTAVTLATGEVRGERWSLTLTQGNAGVGMSFGWEGHGGGGGGTSAPRDTGFGGGIGGGSSLFYPGGDETLSPLPFDRTGVVIDLATSVEYQLNDGTTIPASLYPLPDGTFEVGTKAFLVFVPADTLVDAGYLVAYNGSGAEVGRQYIDFSPVWLSPKIIEEATPAQLDVLHELQTAGGVARRYYDEHGGSFVGLDAESASAISDAIAYNTAPIVMPGEVSLRVSGKDAMVLASATGDGQVYSVCFQYGPDGATYGRNDTSDPSACSNEGWP